MRWFFLCIPLFACVGSGKPGNGPTSGTNPSGTPAGDPCVPGTEICNGLDDDCDGLVDAGAVDALHWYPDADGDGFGVAGAVPTQSCGPPDAGYVRDGTDCDDADPAVNPDAVEICDGIDNNCVGGADADAADAIEQWPDGDGDGFGAGASVFACEPLADHVENDDDCAPADSAIHPAAVEVCDGMVDNDCDGLADDDDPDLTGAPVWFLDGDGDSFGDDARTVVGCLSGSGVAVGGDCDDSDASVNPGAVEVCGDGVDTDCDGSGCGYDGDAWGDAADVRIYANERGGQFGQFLAAGDFDGDGQVDMAASAPWDNTVELGGGSAMVFDGPFAGGLRDDASLARTAIFPACCTGTSTGSGVGQRVASGDLNADGIDELLVSAGADTTQPGRPGITYVFSGPVPSGTYDVTAADHTVFGGPGDLSGTAMLVGDYDDDGTADLLIGASNWSSVAPPSVSVMAGPLPASVTTGSAVSRLEGEDDMDWAGWDVADLGDVTGDGVPDVLVGAPRSTANGGRVYFVAGPLPSGTASLATADAILTTSITGQPRIGRTVAAGGDANGDGYRDGLVGGQGYSPGAPGRAFLLAGPVIASGDIENVALSHWVGGANDYASEGLAAGDVNADGLTDVVVGGSRAEDPSGVQGGAAWLMHGPVVSGQHDLADADARFFGAVINSNLGSDIVLADISGDGLDDIWLSAWGSWAGPHLYRSGEVDVFFGLAP